LEKFTDGRIVKCFLCEEPAIGFCHITALPFGTWRWTISVENVCRYHWELLTGTAA
jgi:hypothetical protein